MAQQDRVYRRPQTQIVDFAFDESVASVFSDMIRRSIPGYETIVPMSALLAARHLETLPATRHLTYDLGCSLGASTLALLRQFSANTLSVVGVDSSPAMIERVNQSVTDPRAQFLCGDILEVPLESAGAVILNFTLQFIAPEHRDTLLQRVRHALEPAGVLVVSEKIIFEDPEEQALFDAAHLDYKRANDYSELEISQKRTALENVMILDSDAQHRERFARAGFGTVRKWYQCLNWASSLVYCQ